MKFNTSEAKFDFKKQVLSGEILSLGKEMTQLLNLRGSKFLTRKIK